MERGGQKNRSLSRTKGGLLRSGVRQTEGERGKKRRQSWGIKLNGFSLPRAHKGKDMGGKKGEKGGGLPACLGQA